MREHGLDAGLQGVSRAGPEGTAPRDALARSEYDLGRGTVLGQPRGPVTVEQGGEQVTLGFVDAPIREFVDATLGGTLGESYVFDDRVQGTVTARTTQPIARAALLPMLENILALNGAALVRGQGAYQVVPIAAVSGLPKVVVTPTSGGQGPGVGIHVIPLDHASVESVQDVVKSQIGPGSQLAADRTRNILIHTGPPAEGRVITDLVSVLDTDVLAGMSFALFPLERARVGDMVLELDAMFGALTTGTQAEAVRFLPVERMNAVLAIARRPEPIRRVGLWIDRLDRADSDAGRRTFVYYAKNSRARDLADVLSEVFDVTPGRASAPRQAVAPGLEPVELMAGPASGDAVGATDEPADTLGSVLDPDGADGAAGWPPALGWNRTERAADIRIVADETHNALVIMATTQQFDMIEDVLNRIDILPLQVLIEATIAEVKLNDALKYGLQWAFQSGSLSGSLINTATGLLGPAFPGFNVVLDTAQVRSVLNALSDVTDVKVVSSPQLMVLDNQSARLQIGDQVPVLTQSAVSIQDPGAPIVNSIQYFDTGVILEVTPRVNASGLVTLEIIQEVSDAVGTTISDIPSPTIQQRQIQSIVAVQSGETVALGGLIRDRAEESETGVPLLMEVPVLGNLFKTTSSGSQRTELLVLITPRAIRGSAQAREVTQELRGRLSILKDMVAEAPE